MKPKVSEELDIIFEKAECDKENAY